jgi:hypothetical protein
VAKTVPATFPGRRPNAIRPRTGIYAELGLELAQGANFVLAERTLVHGSDVYADGTPGVANESSDVPWLTETTSAAYVTRIVKPITTGIGAPFQVAIRCRIEAQKTVGNGFVRMSIYPAAGGAAASSATIAVSAVAWTIYDAAAAGLSPETDYLLALELKSAAGGTVEVWRAEFTEDPYIAAHLP